MSQFVLLLRGVNVGANNSLPMAELRAMLKGIGCRAVATYVQSGNAVLRTSMSQAELSQAASEAVSGYMGRSIDVTTRTRAQLERVVERNPFAAEAAEQPKYVVVSFLSAAPGRAGLQPLREGDWGDEGWKADGAHIYSWHPKGQGRSKLAKTLSTLKLAGTITARNWNTVLKLRDMLDAAD
ncbi:DUF1697 domain-containing protein [Haliangium ochraceum]|uniref:DUF1697 domain-containing protein n=1 Tax=Haliangium ochraceum (strain DSM 14365 / JCM 11303 / SMP-2) TaxID=502025 RepID=D0LVR3_HALO1|nr:DUF1697 domain-containing protein [Haliangium ochraceum]ACY14047.1 protein of unknown function DUF1697 [Haliangium ochraceum DSM 14365]